jgi:hypothetical protein
VITYFVSKKSQAWGVYFMIVFGAGFSLVAVGLFLAGIVGIVLTLIFFVNGEGYEGLPYTLTPVESEVARREVERRLSDLAPRTIMLAERQRGVEAALTEGSPDAKRLRAERLSLEAPTAEVWRSYTNASVLAGEEPLAALEELSGTERTVEAALSKLEEAQELCNGREGA